MRLRNRLVNIVSKALVTTMFLMPLKYSFANDNPEKPKRHAIVVSGYEDSQFTEPMHFTYNFYKTEHGLGDDQIHFLYNQGKDLEYTHNDSTYHVTTDMPGNFESFKEVMNLEKRLLTNPNDELHVHILTHGGGVRKNDEGETIKFGGENYFENDKNDLDVSESNLALSIFSNIPPDSLFSNPNETVEISPNTEVRVRFMYKITSNVNVRLPDSSNIVYDGPFFKKIKYTHINDTNFNGIQDDSLNWNYPLGTLNNTQTYLPVSEEKLIPILVEDANQPDFDGNGIKDIIFSDSTGIFIDWDSDFQEGNDPSKLEKNGELQTTYKKNNSGWIYTTASFNQIDFNNDSDLNDGYRIIEHIGFSDNHRTLATDVAELFEGFQCKVIIFENECFSNLAKYLPESGNFFSILGTDEGHPQSGLCPTIDGLKAMRIVDGKYAGDINGDGLSPAEIAQYIYDRSNHQIIRRRFDGNHDGIATYGPFIGGVEDVDPFRLTLPTELKQEITNVEPSLVNSQEQSLILSQNYPNSFNMQTIIPYTVGKSGDVRLDIYNINGQHVSTLINKQTPKGNHSIIWNATDKNGNNVSSGVYIATLRQDNQYQSIKMILKK